jgi:hypothetical protein
MAWHGKARQGVAGLDRKGGSLRYNPKRLAEEFGRKAAWAGITEAALLADVRDGAPANRRGQLDLIKYTAWLLRQHGYGQKGGGE